MAFLNHAYTILPFLYFARLQPGDRLLIVTDHPERIQADFGPFQLSVTFCMPPGMKGKLTQPLAYPVYEYASDNLTLPGERFEAILLDSEKSDLRAIFQRVMDFLKPGGSLILLDWSVSRKETLQNLPRNLGWTQKEGAAQLPAAIGQGGFIPQWYFLIEPDLGKPRYLALPGFATAIPALSESPLKRRLLQKGFFYFQPHQKVFVASPENTGSLVGDVLSELFPQTAKQKARDKSIRKIYISTTNVLLIQAAQQGKNYFIRFPFTAASIERVKNQEELTTLLYNQGIVGIPRPVPSKKELPLPCYIEEGMPGGSAEKEFAEGSGEAAQKYYQKTQEKIREIHRRFGRVVVFREGEYERFIRPKLETIAQRLCEKREAEAALKRLGEFFREELEGKKMLLGLVHGDFKIGNCLFDRDGNISGIIDWDMGSKEDLALIDVASLLGRSLRQRRRLSLPGLLLKSGNESKEFISIYRRYFEETGTAAIAPFTALLFYWLDRVYKQISFDAELKDSWISGNVYPVIENVDSLLRNSAAREENNL